MWINELELTALLYARDKKPYLMFPNTKEEHMITGLLQVMQWNKLVLWTANQHSGHWELTELGEERLKEIQHG